MSKKSENIDKKIKEVKSAMDDWHKLIKTTEESELQSHCFDMYVKLAIESRKLIKIRRLLLQVDC